jgi:hypothetical protein
MSKTSRLYKKENIQNKINNFLEENFLDIQSLSPNINSLNEAYLARLLTRLAVGSATVWWSLIEIKDFIVLHKKVKGIK